MKDLIRRDALITILGLSIVSVIFLFLIYLPDRKSLAQVEQEINDAESTIQQIPQRISELEKLKKELQQREAYLKRTEDLMPAEADWHYVVHQVADLAKNSELTVSRLEPLQATQRESYRVFPFRLKFSGGFREITTFLRGLESCDRLFQVEELSLNTEDIRRVGRVEGDMYFFAYSSRSKFDDFNENNDNNGKIEP